MKSNPIVDVKLAVLTQPQFCTAVGTDMITVNNWIARDIVRPTQVGARQAKGTRRYSIADAYQGRILNEVIRHHKIGPADAAKLYDAARIAALAKKGGWVEHWARALDENRAFVTSFMVVAWINDCYDAQVVNGDKDGWPDFSSAPNTRRFLKHPFLLLPSTGIFLDVREKCLTMLAGDTP